MFKLLFRCIRRFFSRMKPKQRESMHRSTLYGANIDIEDALAEELEMQRRSGRVLSSTASIAAALRHRPRDTIPVFLTHPGNEEHHETSDLAIKAAVEGMQSLTPRYIGQTSEITEPLMSTKSNAVNHGLSSSSILSSHGSSFKNPESVPEVAEQDEESEALSVDVERLSDLNPRRSSIFNMRSEWI